MFGHSQAVVRGGPGPAAADLGCGVEPRQCQRAGGPRQSRCASKGRLISKNCCVAARIAFLALLLRFFSLACLISLASLRLLCLVRCVFLSFCVSVRILPWVGVEGVA